MEGGLRFRLHRASDSAMGRRAAVPCRSHVRCLVVPLSVPLRLDLRSPPEQDRSGLRVSVNCEAC
jgi:hypothetical protein